MTQHWKPNSQHHHPNPPKRSCQGLELNSTEQKCDEGAAAQQVSTAARAAPAAFGSRNTESSTQSRVAKDSARVGTTDTITCEKDYTRDGVLKWQTREKHDSACFDPCKIDYNARPLLPSTEPIAVSQAL